MLISDYFLSNCVINMWEHMPEYVANAPTINSQYRLDSFIASYMLDMEFNGLLYLLA